MLTEVTHCSAVSMRFMIHHILIIATLSGRASAFLVIPLSSLGHGSTTNTGLLAASPLLSHGGMAQRQRV